MGLTLGPLLGVTLLGMLSRRSNWQGACMGLVIGLSGTAWLTASSAMCPPARSTAACQAGTSVGHVTFFWYGGLLAIAALVSGWLGSLPFPPPPQHQLDGLVLFGQGGRGGRQGTKGNRDNMASSDDRANLLAPLLGGSDADWDKTVQ
eukprot:m.25631 g.25631  ORF g.25631 m.25631 type:complete len:148 (+) comp4255_c0_seq1:74-517(+)